MGRFFNGSYYNFGEIMKLPFKAITLIGHSGIGKTTLSEKLARDGWYHYSGDYRIATHYLNDAIDDWLKTLAASVPELARLMNLGVVDIQGRVSIEQLAVLSSYIGKVGLQGLPFAEFCHRQAVFCEAEKKAMYDIEHFLSEANSTWFINDAGGSLGEYIDDVELMAFLSQRTLMVYLHAEDDLQSELEIRAAKYPKPICYEPNFLHKMVNEYGSLQGIDNPDEFDSDDFLRFVGPKMLRHRREKYLNLAQRYGIILPVKEVWACEDADAFLRLVELAYAEKKESSFP